MCVCVYQGCLFNVFFFLLFSNRQITWLIKSTRKPLELTGRWVDAVRTHRAARIRMTAVYSGPIRYRLYHLCWRINCNNRIIRLWWCNCIADTVNSTGVTASRSWIDRSWSKASSSSNSRNRIRVVTRRNFADHMKRMERANMATNANLLTDFTNCAVSSATRNTRRNCAALSTPSAFALTDLAAILSIMPTRHATIRRRLRLSRVTATCIAVNSLFRPAEWWVATDRLLIRHRLHRRWANRRPRWALSSRTTCFRVIHFHPWPLHPDSTALRRSSLALQTITSRPCFHLAKLEAIRLHSTTTITTMPTKTTTTTSARNVRRASLFRNLIHLLRWVLWLPIWILWVWEAAAAPALRHPYPARWILPELFGCPFSAASPRHWTRIKKTKHSRGGCYAIY